MNTGSTAPPIDDYILGVDDAELHRLGLQHRLWTRHAMDAWERAGVGPGQTILDIGCGPGFASIDLAMLAGPTGRVVAVDGSEKFIQHLQARARLEGLDNIETRVGDAQKLDLAPGSVDRAWARWVLCFVENPEAVVAGTARALKPGGAFAVFDYFNYTAVTLAPRSEIFTRIVQATAKSWTDSGGDPDLAGRLPAMMAAHGLEVRAIRPIVRIARPGSLLWRWPESFFSNWTPKLVAKGLITQDEHNAFHEEWAKRSRDPNTFLSTPPVYEVIGFKPGA